MAQTYLSRFLAIMRRTEAELTELYEGLAAFATQEITRRADADGTLPREATFELQQVIGRRVTGMFLAPTAGGERAPFATMRDGTVHPLSPYMRVIWRAIEDATRLRVEQHAGIMRRRLRGAPDVLAALQRARRNPFLAGRQVSEQVVFQTNPLANYDPAHLWVDPAGHTLSDRIWDTAGNTRRRLDLYLEDAIAEGRGSLDISRDLERFLLPGRKLHRTKKPYGVNASFDGMRLARTEITHASARADEIAALQNPFVEGMEVRLSLSHPREDICDEAAAAGPFPVGDIPAQYQIPLHPQCLCHYAKVLVDNSQEILDELRADIQRSRSQLADKVGPLQVERFVQMLLGLGLRTAQQEGIL